MIPSTFKSQGFFFKEYTLLGEYESGMIIEWRNYPTVRNAMKNPVPISFLDHFDFLEELSIDKTKRYFYVTQTYPIGVIYVENIQNSSGELGFFVAPEIMKNGFGTQILKTFIDTVELENFSVELREENVAGEKSVLKCGFSLDSSYDGFKKYIFSKK